jgi:alanine racemase
VLTSLGKRYARIYKGGEATPKEPATSADPAAESN